MDPPAREWRAPLTLDTVSPPLREAGPDMTRRRSLLAALVVAVLVATAGVAWVVLTPRAGTIASAPTSPATAPATTPGAPGTSDDDAPPPHYAAVDSDLVHDLNAAPGTSQEATFLADPPALADPAFREFSAGLTDHGHGLYSGKLSSADLATLDSVPGLKVSQDRPLELDPGTETNSDGDLKTEFDDFDENVRTTIDQVEPGLAAARAAQNVQGTGSVIAIIDTGIDTHAAGLTGKVIERVDLSGSSPTCDAGYLDPVGHGTHVASIAAGGVVSGPNGFAGVAPGAKLVDVRIFDCDEHSGSGLLTQALNWVLTNRVRLNISVVNLSVASVGSVQDGTDANSILVNRLVAAGVFVAAAAGNEGDGPSTIYSPGSARYATTVGAAGVGDFGAFLAPYSSQGPINGRHGIDVLAAGSSIVAARTTAQGTTPATIAKSGTSMASPFVAGVAALLRQKFPTHKPSGQSCTLGPSCPEGVTGVTNGFENDFSVGDWFAPGEDDLSGRGLVSATNTILGAPTPASTNLDFSLHADGPTIIAVPPHASGAIVNMVTDSSIVADGWSNDTLGYTWLSATGETLPSSTPCSILDGTSGGSVCLTTAASFGQRIWQFMSPATTDTTYLSLQSTREMHAVLTVPGIPATLAVSDGIRVDDTELDEFGSGSLDVVRTRSSGSDTALDIGRVGGLVTADTVVLPAGPAGTDVTIPITYDTTYTAPPGESGGRILLTVGGALAGAVSVSYPGAAALSARLTIGGKQIHAPDTIGSVRLLTNGAVFGQSKDPSIVPSPPPAQGHYEWPFLVAPGSNAIVKVPMTQTVNSSLDAFDASGDATRLLIGEYPGGAGLVAGDTDNRYVTFVHDTGTGANTAIGGPGVDPIQYASWMSQSGASVAFFRDSGSSRQVYRQGGAGYSDLRLLATLPSTDNATIADVSEDAVLVRTFPASGYQNLWLYRVDGSDPVLVSPVAMATTPVFSEDGSAFGIAEGFTDLPGFPYTPVCFHTDTLERVDFPAIDRPVYGQIAVGNDCASITAEVELQQGASPRGTLGVKLIRATAGGAVETLARDESSVYFWIMDPTGVQFATSTSRPLESGDTKGLGDIYRGLFSSRPFTAIPAPIITGVFRSGSTLTASIPTWTPSATRYSYQWYRNGTALDGATTATHVAADADMGKTLTVTVTGSRFDYQSTSVSSAASPPIGGLTFVSKVPVITGTPEVGKSLLVTMAPWGPAPLQFEGHWERDGVPISGIPSYGGFIATAITAPITFSGYVVQPADAGTNLTFVVTGSKAGYMPAPVSSAPLHIKDLFDTTASPVIDGIGRTGTTLTATLPGWSPVPTTATYIWKRNGVAITGAIKSTYKLTTADAGKSITVTVTAGLPGYSNATSTSGALSVERLLTTTAPIITGTNAIGGMVTASPGVWTAGTTFAYQWRRNGVDIPGATDITYQITVDDAGTTLTVAQTGTKTMYTPVTQVSVGLVVKRLFTATPDPTISGTPRVGAALSIVRGIWAPATSVTYTYKWKRDGVTIAGATLSTYLLTTADAGKTITVVVVGAKTGYFSATRTSAPLVIEKLLTQKPIPLIQGAPDAGVTLTVVTGVWLPAPVDLAIQWKRNGVALAGETGPTYTLTTTDAGATITVGVTGSQAAFTSVSKSSAALVIRKQMSVHPVPVITGVPAVGTKLTAVAGSWTPATATLAYQWLRDGSPIAGATAKSYTPIAADAGTELSVRVTGTKTGYSPHAEVSLPAAIPSP
jgi:subtilisin family serine protease